MDEKAEEFAARQLPGKLGELQELYLEATPAMKSRHSAEVVTLRSAHAKYLRNKADCPLSARELLMCVVLLSKKLRPQQRQPAAREAAERAAEEAAAEAAAAAEEGAPPVRALPCRGPHPVVRRAMEAAGMCAKRPRVTSPPAPPAPPAAARAAPAAGPAARRRALR
eukprot:TRINITY_DN31876_c0_g1_i1.p2 TRINITY_DN31876_c0_g1~~TRINITY_DN31876_c0_g1_i1.p2  ORF type:complete len:195 (+),score=91.21 TRINITY_DN31876_c0_g1_i1:85-585(+)